MKLTSRIGNILGFAPSAVASVGDEVIKEGFDENSKKEPTFGGSLNKAITRLKRWYGKNLGVFSTPKVGVLAMGEGYLSMDAGFYTMNEMGLVPIGCYKVNSLKTRAIKKANR